VADFLVTAVCVVVVLFYAAKRYNTPETNRLSTTQSLFLLTGAGYLAATVALFFILSEIALKPGVLPFLGVKNAQEVIKEFTAPPVLAAVILTTLLPNIVVVRDWDEWILKRFQAWGRIPQGVRNLADMMTQNALGVTEKDLSDLKKWIHNDADASNDLDSRISTDSAETPSGSFTHILRLYLDIEDLKALPDYAKAFRNRHDTWQTINADFRVFLAQSLAFFVLFDQLTPVKGVADETAFKQAKDRYDDICQKMHGHLAEFLAGLLLMVEGTEQRIKSRLEALGFCIQERTCPALPVGPFVFRGVVMVVAVLGVVGIVPQPQSGPLPLPLTAFLIGVTKTIGVLAAVLPKLRWSAFRPSSDGSLPYSASLTSAVLAALISLLMERAAIAIAHQTISGAFEFGTYPLTPLAPTTFAISLSIAIICDIDLHLGRGWMQRITEGMLCGAAMVTSLFICLRLLDIPSSTEAHTSPWFPYAFSFSLGFIAGFVAPYLYRRALSEGPQVRTAAVPIA